MIRRSKPGGLVSSPPPSYSSLPIRSLRLLGGLPLVSAGIAAMLQSRLGVAPFDVLTSGTAHRTGLTVGTAFLLLTAVAVIVGLLLRVRPGVGTLAVVLMVGPGVDLGMRLIPEPGPVALQAVLLAVGLTLMCTGIALIVSSDLGPGPTEILMVGLARGRLGVRQARWLLDGGFFVVGWLLGGSVGVGTAAAVLLTAPLLAGLLQLLAWSPSGT